MNREPIWLVVMVLVVILDLPLLALSWKLHSVFFIASVVLAVIAIVVCVKEYRLS